MKSNKKPWPLSTTNSIKDRINTNPDFQRPAVWSKAQKQMLIDTILRDYDVPKLYWRRTGEKPDRYDVVDGQQRLRAIWDFFGGGFALPKDADPVDGYTIAGCSYEDLPDDLRIKFDMYPLDVVVLEDTDEDEVREMFLRLQNGTSLKAQEKRNAFPGRMREFVREMSTHPFFDRVGFANKRFNHDLVAAQLTCLELNGGPANVRSADLNKMYTKEQDFDMKGQVARSVKRTLGYLAEIFPEKTPELERYNVVAVYCVLAELDRQYVFGEIKDKFYDWFIEFESERRRQDELPDDAEDFDSEWRTYKEKISHSTDAAESIRYRMDFMLRRLLQAFPGLSRKDNQRDFTHQQRLAVFRRDGGFCQLKLRCSGDKVSWDDWHCDHRLAWSKGGHSTVENGVVACPACNLAKGND